MDWFLYDRDLCHKRFKGVMSNNVVVSILVGITCKGGDNKNGKKRMWEVL